MSKIIDIIANNSFYYSLRLSSSILARFQAKKERVIPLLKRIAKLWKPFL